MHARTDGRRLESHTISSPGAFSSGELKTTVSIGQDKETFSGLQIRVPNQILFFVISQPKHMF